ncbi:MAG: hypothetical protein GY871_06320 [Actinomycetales bacterium]|nr:hypothetical protein [Actinomycetales bacterium]
MKLWTAIWDRLDEWGPLTYRYTDAGTPWESVDGLSIRMGTKRPTSNCSVFVWSALLKGLEDIGRAHTFDKGLQGLAMVYDADQQRAGVADAAVRLGVATMIDIEDYGPGTGPCVVQVWRYKGSPSGGHAMFWQSCSTNANATEAVHTMECNGRNDGSGSALGLNGVGCRTKTRDSTWRALGALPPVEECYTLAELRATYDEIFISRLFV